ERLLRSPITGIAGCCARAASGHEAAPPMSVMNARRFIIRSPRYDTLRELKLSSRHDPLVESRCAIYMSRLAGVVGNIETLAQILPIFSEFASMGISHIRITVRLGAAAGCRLASTRCPIAEPVVGRASSMPIPLAAYPL